MAQAHGDMLGLLLGLQPMAVESVVPPAPNAAPASAFQDDSAKTAAFVRGGVPAAHAWLPEQYEWNPSTFVRAPGFAAGAWAAGRATRSLGSRCCAAPCAPPGPPPGPPAGGPGAAPAWRAAAPAVTPVRRGFGPTCRRFARLLGPSHALTPRPARRRSWAPGARPHRATATAWSGAAAAC